MIKLADIRAFEFIKLAFAFEKLADQAMATNFRKFLESNKMKNEAGQSVFRFSALDDAKKNQFKQYVKGMTGQDMESFKGNMGGLRKMMQGEYDATRQGGYSTMNKKNPAPSINSVVDNRFATGNASAHRAINAMGKQAPAAPLATIDQAEGKMKVDRLHNERTAPFETGRIAAGVKQAPDKAQSNAAIGEFVNRKPTVAAYPFKTDKEMSNENIKNFETITNKGAYKPGIFQKIRDMFSGKQEGIESTGSVKIAKCAERANFKDAFGATEKNHITPAASKNRPSRWHNNSADESGGKLEKDASIQYLLRFINKK